MIEVDGSIMEGGGQLLRMATTYSAILSEPIRVVNIRAKRNNPGLKPQHLTTLQAVAKLCAAETRGLEIGSLEIEFHPGRLRGGSFDFDIGTAGSCSLLLQCAAPAAAYADGPIHLRVKGGTAVRWSPPMTIVQRVVWEGLRRMGFQGEVRVLREGYHPRGGGVVEAKIRPVKGFSAISGEKADVRLIRGLSTCGGLPRTVAERQAEAALRVLREAGFEARIDVATPGKGSEPYSPGSVICLWVEGGALIGDDGLGERGKPAEKVGSEAAERLIEQIKTGAYVDMHTADNLILPCSLAAGTSIFTVSRITLHTLTAAEIARRFTGARIEIEGAEGKPGRVTVEGKAIANPRWVG